MESVSFYPQMMMQQGLNPGVHFSEPSKEFMQLNRSEKVLFDFDLHKHLSLVKRQEVKVSGNDPSQYIINDYNYAYDSHFTETQSANQSAQQ